VPVIIFKVKSNHMKQWILNNLIVNGKLPSKRCNKNWFLKFGFEKNYNEIISLTFFLDSTNPKFSQRIWHIVNNNLEKYKCQNHLCNNIPKFVTFTRGYLNTCCSRCAQLNENTIQKIRTTNQIRYGSNYGLQNELVKQKSKATLTKKYGVQNISQLKETSDKKKKTCLKNHGVKWYLERKNDIKQFVIQKYGVDNVQKSATIRQKTIQTRRSIFYDSLFNSSRLNGLAIPLFSKQEYVLSGLYEKYKFRCLKCKTEFKDCLEDGDLPRCPKCFRGRSWFQQEVLEFLQSILSTETITENNKTILTGNREIDLYVPSKEIAIECDGLFWHGELNGKQRNYHINKSTECEKKHIKLIHIFEDEWMKHKHIVKNRLVHVFGKSIKSIYGRVCTVEEIDGTKCNLFLNNNHLQGGDKSQVKLGLFYKSELVGVMTFGGLRAALGNAVNVGSYELYRFCTSKPVVGGAGKLLEHFKKKYQPDEIITYADRRWNFTDPFYSKLGFVFSGYTPPNYWYFGKHFNYKRYHRFSFRKDRQEKILKIFNPNISEWENMKNNGWDRIWDCGSFKYKWQK